MLFGLELSFIVEVEFVQRHGSPSTPAGQSAKRTGLRKTIAIRSYRATLRIRTCWINGTVSGDSVKKTSMFRRSHSTTNVPRS